jgi:hypothetical protein
MLKKKNKTLIKNKKRLEKKKFIKNILYSENIISFFNITNYELNNFFFCKVISKKYFKRYFKENKKLIKDLKIYYFQNIQNLKRIFEILNKEQIIFLKLDHILFLTIPLLYEFIFFNLQLYFLSLFYLVNFKFLFLLRSRK